MSWHGYKKGNDYARDEVVARCEKYIRSGKVIEPERKMLYVQQIKDSVYERIVYSPRNEKGWGSSPINPDNWQRPGRDGGPICERKSIPKDRRK